MNLQVLGRYCRRSKCSSSTMGRIKCCTIPTALISRKSGQSDRTRVIFRRINKPGDSAADKLIYEVSGINGEWETTCVLSEVKLVVDDGIEALRITDNFRTSQERGVTEGLRQGDFGMLHERKKKAMIAIMTAEFVAHSWCLALFSVCSTFLCSLRHRRTSPPSFSAGIPESWQVPW